jgi:hypothetical protein
MGIKKNNVIHGTVGTIVCYQLGGKEVVRSLPGRVRQSRATKASAKDFGKIKKLSRFLRIELSSVLPTYKSMPVMFAMDSSVRRWYHEFYRNTEQVGFDPSIFNNLELKPGLTSSVKELLGTEPVVIWSENKVELQFPAIKKSDLSYSGVTAISFCVKISGAIVLPDGQIPNSVRGTSYSIDKTIDENGIDAFSVIIDKFKQPLQGLFVAYLSLRFQTYKQWSDNEHMKPVVVVGSWFNGVRPVPVVKKDDEED